MTKVFKIAVCAGHGGYKSLNPKVYATAGKRTPEGEPEWIFNDKLVRAFIEEINIYENVEVRRFDDPTGKTDVPLTTRTNLANAWGADIYISFHHNANTAKWGDWTGVETFTYLGSNPRSEKLAKLVHNEIVKAYGLRDRGVKKANLHIVRESKASASILIEGGFMDSRIDIKKLRDDSVLKNAGIGVANGVAKYANLKKKVTTASIPDEKKPQYTETTILYNDNKISGLIDNGVTYVQLRELSELLNVSLGYNATTKEVSFNGKVVSPIIIEGRSFMKVREVVEELGKKVYWDGKSVHIK